MILDRFSTASPALSAGAACLGYAKPHSLEIVFYEKVLYRTGIRIYYIFTEDELVRSEHNRSTELVRARDRCAIHALYKKYGVVQNTQHRTVPMRPLNNAQANAADLSNEATRNMPHIRHASSRLPTQHSINFVERRRLLDRYSYK